MSTSKLSTLAGIAEERADRSAVDLEQRRTELARTRVKYEQLASYARDYRDNAANEGLPAALQSRQRFQMSIDQHVSDLAEQMRAKREAVERMTESVREDRASASALQALQARGAEQDRRRAERRTENAFDAAFASRHAAARRDGDER